MLLFFLFLLFRRPPSPTLFTYTTLFRSPSGTLVCWTRQGLGPNESIRCHQSRSRAGSVSNLGDRKSTRLNSSHVAISYAVFCLKKKTNVSHLAGKMVRRFHVILQTHWRH